MAITAPDIKLLESERMADTTDGGGRRTSRVIPDGVAGNIFPKVSRLDSVYGRVNLRKVYGAVQTADTDTYAGAHVVITDAPDNDKIHTTLFSTASDFDTRTSARDRIESYVTSGPESRMVLLGRQLAGQQSIVAYQRVEEPLPEVGEVFCLSSETGGVVTQQQYVRIDSVEHEIRTYEDDKGEFKRRIVTMGTGVSLRYEFNGPENALRYNTAVRPALLRTTTVVDAARYFGIKPLAESAAMGDLEIKVPSVYTPIVPTTNRETPLSNAQMGGVVNIVPAKATTRTETAASSWAVADSRFTLRPITPGTLTISGSGVTTLTDDKKGGISNGTFSATVDYENGTITRTGGTASAGSYTLTYQPGGVATQTAHTMDEPITLANRGSVYVFTLNPLPSPGTAYVDFRALGKWYRLRDNGNGELAGGDVAYGVGSINYATGGVVLTLGALPDVGSSVLLGWGTPAHYIVRADATGNVSNEVLQTATLPELPIAPDSLALSYVSNGVTYTATDNSSGNITGDGLTGSINYITGVVELKYTTRLPDAGSNVAFTYNQIVPTVPGEPVVLSLSSPAATTVNLGTGVSVGSFNGSMRFGGNLGANLFVVDNGAGLLVVKAGQKITGYHYNTGSSYADTDDESAKDGVVVQDQVIGTINYTTGVLSITAGVAITYQEYNGNAFVMGWFQRETTLGLAVGTAANYGWKDSGVSSSATARSLDVSFTTSPIRLDLTAMISERYTPGSLMFSLGGKTYIDRNGSLYYDVSNITGSGLLGGTVDYTTGKVSLSSWTNGAALSLTVLAGLTTYGAHSAMYAQFRTSGSPIRTGSFYVQATTANGSLLAATSNDNGVISGPKVAGTIDQESGVVRLVFGEMVAAAGNEGEDWYDADAVVGGQIFKPEPIIPSTLTYNAVVLANLPLNADILGLDPVRLPSDGRVPIYRAADVVVIHNTADFTLPDPVVAGATYSVSRTNLSEVWLVDQNGVKVPASQFIYSLTNGTVTMGAELSLTGLVQPLIAKHRVEDLALLSDVQINGQLTLSAPLSRAYSAGTSWVSSAILFGDMNARVENVHDLGSFTAWTNVVGTQSNAQYNDIDYPIEILNNGGLTERWRINFTSTTAFQVIGENLGVIATGSTASDLSPTNALTGNPYFVIRAAGWGSGWSAGNQLRFNTIGAAAPIWIARTVLPGATLEGDSFSLQCRGDVDAE